MSRLVEVPIATLKRDSNHEVVIESNPGWIAVDRVEAVITSDQPDCCTVWVQGSKSPFLVHLTAEQFMERIGDDPIPSAVREGV